MEPRWGRRRTCRPSRRSASRSTRAPISSLSASRFTRCVPAARRSPGDTTGELLISIVQQVQITPAQLNPDVPEGLARIIDRCLEKDRELRYQHASEIRADLERVQRDPAAVVDRPSPFPQEKPPSKTSSGPRTWDQAVPREPASRRRWLVPLLGLLAIATAIMAYYRASTPPVPEVSNYTQLTHDGEAKSLAGTDGSRLYLGMEYQTAPGIAQMPVTGGDPVRMPAPAEYTLPVGISADGTELLAIERQGLELTRSRQSVAAADAQWPTAPDRQCAGHRCSLVSRRRHAGLLQSRRPVSFRRRRERSTEAGFARRIHHQPPILPRWETDSVHLAERPRHCESFPLGDHCAGETPSSPASGLAPTIHRCKRKLDRGWEVFCL